MNDIYMNDIYKTVVFEDFETAHGTLVLLMDIASEAFAATVWDYMILINENYDDNDLLPEVTDNDLLPEVTDYGWTLDQLCRAKVIDQLGRPILVLPKPDRVLQIYDEEEERETYGITNLKDVVW